LNTPSGREVYIWPEANLAISQTVELPLAAVTADAPYPCFADTALTEALADAPVVLIHGPRQCGKTTLAQGIASSRGYAYFSFDDAGGYPAALDNSDGEYNHSH
jgi:SpoVK/Ycf46/Vps4 family AAA+-type ATPase